MSQVMHVLNVAPQNGVYFIDQDGGRNLFTIARFLPLKVLVNLASKFTNKYLKSGRGAPVIKFT